MNILHSEKGSYLELKDVNTIHEASPELALRIESNGDNEKGDENDLYYGAKEVVASAELLEEDRDNSEVIKLNNIHKTYLLGIEGVPALRGVSMSVRRGEFVCIYGTSGGGKTSMLNIIGTIDKPTKGELFICGTRIDSKTSDTELALLRLRKLGFVFQTFNLISSLTALENVEMPMILAGKLNSQERRARAIELLESVGIGKRLDHFPSQLSGGEQQRVTIARAMANKPDILLLDEPTGDLDTVNSLIVLKLLTDLNKQQKITLIMVTHDMGLKHFADRVIWMRDGKIQRVEMVPEKKRTETYAKLHQDIIEIHAAKKRDEDRLAREREEIVTPVIVGGDDESLEKLLTSEEASPPLPDNPPEPINPTPNDSNSFVSLSTLSPSIIPSASSMSILSSSTSSTSSNGINFSKTCLRRQNDYEIFNYSRTTVTK